MRELLERLGRPQDGLRFVHVAGTNGKGSTCAYLASVLQAAGFKTGLFTSPFIETFEERIRVGGRNIPLDDLTEVTLAVRDAAEAMDDHPTEFELMCAVALLHFVRSECQMVVLEVGLGGRFDATNVIDAPEVCVIARIGLDHTAVLGDTLAAISGEKVGIIKPGAAVVSWPQEPEAMEVVRRVAAERGCSVQVPDFSQLSVESLRLGKSGGEAPCSSDDNGVADAPFRCGPTETGCAFGSLGGDGGVLAMLGYDPIEVNGASGPSAQVGVSDGSLGAVPDVAVSLQGSEFAMRTFSYGRYAGLQTKLLAAYQPYNAALAVQTVEALRARGWDISDEALRAGIAAAEWPGRFEVVAQCPLTIVDGGHNPQGAAALAETLRDVLPGRRPWFVMGVLADKEYESMLAEVLPLAAGCAVYAPDNPRALQAEDLAAAIHRAARQDAGAFEVGERGEADGAILDVRKDAVAAEFSDEGDIPVEVLSSPTDAMNFARQAAGPDGVVVAFGTLYAVGDLKAALRK